MKFLLTQHQQTLENLQSLVDNYQEIRVPAGEGGATQRSWKSSVKKNYKKIYWTSEGGNIQALRNMLQMHLSSISLSIKALQRYGEEPILAVGESLADKIAVNLSHV